VYFLSFFTIRRRSYFTFYAFANKLLSDVQLKYFSAYILTDVVIKSLELSSRHEDVKFINLFGVAAQKVDVKIVHMNTIIKKYVMN
jgi:hypothetical protein